MINHKQDEEEEPKIKWRLRKKISRNQNFPNSTHTPELDLCSLPPSSFPLGFIWVSYEIYIYIYINYLYIWCVSVKTLWAIDADFSFKKTTTKKSHCVARSNHHSNRVSIYTYTHMYIYFMKNLYIYENSSLKLGAFNTLLLGGRWGWEGD